MPLSTLCQRCGLCCDGSLFTHVPLQRTELAALQQRGLETVERADGTPALEQCCAALQGTRCTVYAERPQSCRRYRCLLYAALAEKEVSLEEALGVVEQAQTLVARAAAGGLTPEARAAWERAQGFLARHFLGSRGL